MAGTFVSANGQRWSAASWLFSWILRTIAGTIDDAELSAKLREIDGNNLGWFSLQDCSSSQRQQISAVICTSLVAAAEQEFRVLMIRPENLERITAHLQALVAICCE